MRAASDFKQHFRLSIFPSFAAFSLDGLSSASCEIPTYSMGVEKHGRTISL
jgi:hypothetical protein